jgi:trimeric autotransporter adhesin
MLRDARVRCGGLGNRRGSSATGRFVKRCKAGNGGRARFVDTVKMRLKTAALPVVFLLLVLCVSTLAQVQKRGGVSIQGIIKSGNTPLPGASVDAVESDKPEHVTTATDLNGRYLLRLPGPGTYVVTVEMTAFAPVERQVVVADGSAMQADFDLVLRSRSQTTATPPSIASRGRGAFNRPRPENSQGETENDSANDLSIPSNEAIPGMAVDAPTESVAVSGNTAAPTFDGMFDPDRLRDGQLDDFGGQRGPGGPGGGGRGGPGGGPLGRGARGGGLRGGGRGFAIGGGRGQFANRPNISANYSLANSALDAAPYSLTGQPTPKPDYGQSRFGVNVGGPLKIPKLFDFGERNFFVFTYNGVRSRNPFDAFSTVPTIAERAGDFSRIVLRNGSSLHLVDPATGAALQNNQIPRTLIDPAASALLSYIPLPNLPGATQNFHFVTTNNDNEDDVNLRFNHTFGPTTGQRGLPRGGFGGGFGGGRGGGARGGRSLSFGLQYRSQDRTVNNAFPTIGGTSAVLGLNIPVSFSHSIGRLTNNIQFGFSRARNSMANLYSGIQDVAGNAGILGVSQNPFDWGIPRLSFTNFTGVTDTSTSQRINQTLQLGDTMLWARGKHSMRWGGQFRRIQLNTRTNDNARGSFTFTGAASGFDFADFLLGRPQLTSIEYGTNSYRFRAKSWNAFFQDDWRILPKLTLNLGLRYEYVSPFTEVDNRLVNLDVAPAFTAAAPVLSGGIGAFSGLFPLSLVNPDRNNFAPRLGIAWRVTNNNIVRAGYGISYNNAAYNNIVQQLAFQPPFAVTQTNIASVALPLTLQNGFPVLPASTITNSFGVDRDYRIGYVQTWNLDVQHQISPALVLTLDYTGTKGTRLDVLQAPNRTAAGLRIANVQPFIWESSDASSIAHAASVRLRKRLTLGFSAGGSYTFSKSSDNASSTSTATGVVAQNAFDLAAERGLSNFDQTHRFTGDYLWELPFGENKPWLSNAGVLHSILGNWQLSGAWTIASGTPYTARILGEAGDILRGTNGTVRANATGLPVALSDPAVAAWFNLAAFALPAPGQFGNAGRNTIRGPGTLQFDMALNRSVMLRDRYPLDLRIQATNVFNTPQFRVIDTIVNSPSFGQVTSVGSMRKLQMIVRVRF